MVDNCTIHTTGDNIGIQEILFEDFGILMIILLPYHPDFNPTELVFQTLLTQIKSKRARYKSLKANNFLQAINMEMNKIGKCDVLLFYCKCGYCN